ncbi:hypothetical protein SAMN04488084_102329 [Pedobacter antarcticus]|nr:hypothetical protein SAMN04488084_102329 [Pedobacter antarcticus]
MGAFNFLLILFGVDIPLLYPCHTVGIPFLYPLGIARVKEGYGKGIPTKDSIKIKRGNKKRLLKAKNPDIHPGYFNQLNLNFRKY